MDNQNKNRYGISTDRPKTLREKIIGKRYSFEVGLIGTAVLIWLIDIRDKLSWARFVPFFIIASVFGIHWNWFMCHFDPFMPAWAYKAWAFSGISIGKMALDDFVFYPACGGLFFLIRLILKHHIKVGADMKWLKRIVFGVLVAITGLVWNIFSVCGQSIVVYFVVPGLAAILVSWKRWNVLVSLALAIFVVTMAGWWDIIDNLIIPQVAGFEWGNTWHYVLDGRHSAVFLDIATHPWAWTETVPLEIMPWFAVGGWLFIDGLANWIYDRT